MTDSAGQNIATVSVDSEQLYDLAQAVLGQGALFTFHARGASMRPFIRWGDRLTIAPCRGQDLRRGEVAFYLGEGQALMAHRVLGTGQGGSVLYMRGDGALRRPEAVSPADVLGRVIVAERAGRQYLPSAWPARLVSMAWHALYPHPLRAYLRMARLWHVLRHDQG